MVKVFRKTALILVTVLSGESLIFGLIDNVRAEEMIQPNKDNVTKDITSEIVNSARDDQEKELDTQIDSQKDLTNIVKQTTDYTCGPAALATLINLMGGNATENQLAALSGTTEENGTSMLGLKKAAKELKYSVQGKKMSLSNLTKIEGMFIANTTTGDNVDHYLVVKNITKDVFFIADPMEGNYSLSQNEFKNVYKGNVLVIKPTENTIIELNNGEKTTVKELTKDAVQEAIYEMSDEDLSQVKDKWLNAVAMAIVRSTGMVVSSHALQRIIERGITSKLFLDVFRGGTLFLDTETGYMVRYKKEVAVIYQGARFVTVMFRDKIKKTWVRLK